MILFVFVKLIFFGMGLCVSHARHCQVLYKEALVCVIPIIGVWEVCLLYVLHVLPIHNPLVDLQLCQDVFVNPITMEFHRLDVQLVKVR